MIKRQLPAVKKKHHSSIKYGHSSILSATQDYIGNVYAPQSKETKQAYEMLLGVLERILGDIPSDVVRSAVDGGLEILKQDTITDMEKKSQIQELLSSDLNNEEFTNLLALSKKITDYDVTTGDTEKGPDDYGVAVIFDEDEESEDMEVVQDIQEDEMNMEDVTNQQVLKSKTLKEEEEGKLTFIAEIKI